MTRERTEEHKRRFNNQLILNTLDRSEREREREQKEEFKKESINLKKKQQTSKLWSVIAAT